MTCTACTVVLILAAKFYIGFLVVVFASHRSVCFPSQVYTDYGLPNIKVFKNNLFAVILRYDSARLACVSAWLNVFSIILVTEIAYCSLVYRCETVGISH